MSDEHDRAEILVRSAIEGDSDAFQRLLEQHRAVIGTTLVACGIRCRETAFDVAQEVALRAWSRLPTLREPRAFGGWLRRIAANAARDQLRRELARRETPLEDAEERLISDGDPTSAVDREEELRAMREALRDEEEIADLLRAQAEGASIEELSQRAGLTPGALKMRLSRGRDRVRRRLRLIAGRPKKNKRSR